MPAPVARVFEVTIHGEKRQVTLQPTILSRRSYDALIPVYNKNLCITVGDRLTEIAELERTRRFPDEIIAQMRSEATSPLQKANSLADIETVIAQPEGMIIGLTLNSDLTREDAVLAVNETPSLTTIFADMAKVLREEDDAAKNS